MSWIYGHKKEYLSLVQQFPLVIINSRAQHAAAIFVITALAIKPKMTKAESDYFRVLVQLIEGYERKVVPHVSVKPQEIMEYLMELHDLTQAGMASILGMQKSHFSEYMAQKRTLPKTAAARLGARFKLDPMFFLPKVEPHVEAKDQIEDIDMIQYSVPGTSSAYMVKEKMPTKYKHKKAPKTTSGTRSARKPVKSKKG